MASSRRGMVAEKIRRILIQPMNRAKNLHRLASETFDVLVIGGGAIGLGCALDSVLRCLKTGLIEGDKFASGASSRSTKLVHGGVRYLEKAIKQADFSQLKFVREALKERAIMLKNAPNLTRVLPIIIPVYHSLEKVYFSLGLKFYDFLAGKNNLVPSKTLSKSEVLKLLPSLKKDGLKGGILYFDGQFDDAKFAFSLAQTAENEGAVIANFTKFLDFRKANGKISGAMVCNEQTGEKFEIKARIVVNATGAFGDQIRQKANPEFFPKLHPTKGIHLLFPSDILGGKTGILIPKTDDGRMIFALPWNNRVLVGTTDTEPEVIENAPPVLDSEIAYLLDHLNRVLSKIIAEKDILESFAGLRPLLKSSECEAKFFSREHEIEVDSSGLISILGGKWTTYRLMAEQTIDAVLRYLNEAPRPCKTQDFRLTEA